MSHFTVIWVYTTRIAKQHDELLISILLLLLILLIYLGMCPSVPTNIHSYMSKLRLLLDTSGGINEQCLQWVPCMPGTTVQGVPSLVYETGRKAYSKWVLFICPFKKVTGRRIPTYPSEHVEALRWNRKFGLYNIPNTTVNTNTYWYTSISPDPM